MAMFNDPNARVRKPGPNIVPVSGVAPEIPGGGMTLDALMARQKALAGQKIPMGEMRSPMQGAAYALERGLQGFQEGMLQRHEGEARDALAKAMTQVDPVTGEYRPEAMATIGALMPEQAFDISRDTVKARRDIARQEDEQKATADLAKQQQDFTGGQNELNRQADAARVRMQEAAADGRQDDAQAAAKDLAKINAELKIAQDQLASERDATKPITDIAKAKADLDAGRITQAEFDAQTSAGPSTDAGKVMDDFNKGAFGDPATPEAQALRDAALKKATTSSGGGAANQKVLYDQQDQYIETSSNVGQLQRAMELLNQGINTGYTAGGQTVLGKIGLGDEEQAKRTDEYNRIMNPQAIAGMGNALKGATTDTELQEFIKNMNDPTIAPEVKAKQIETMLLKAQTYQETQRQRIIDMGGTVPEGAKKAAPQDEEALLQDARDAIAKGAPPDLVKKRLSEKGVDVGKL